MFHGTRLAAQAAGLPFRWFTLESGTIKFCHESVFCRKTLRQAFRVARQLQCSSSHLAWDHGSMYGATYFRDIANLLVRAVLRLDEVQSFADLAHYAIKHPDLVDVPTRIAKDATHLEAILDDLASVQTLNVTAKTATATQIDNMIDLSTLLSKSQVVYFYLQSTKNKTLCEIVSKLAAFLLLTSAADKDNNQTKRVFVLIDEFQRVVSQEMCIFLQQGRGFGVGCILAHQTTGDLDTPAGDFRDVIEESTNIKIDLTASSARQLERLIAESPEVIGYRRTTSPLGDSIAEFGQPSLNSNDLMAISSKKQVGLVRVRNAEGLTQLGGLQIPFRTMFHISQKEYQKRMTSSWPSVEANPGTLSYDADEPAAGPDKKIRTRRQAFQEKETEAETKQPNRRWVSKPCTTGGRTSSRQRLDID